MISKNNENQNIKKELKDNYKVFRTFNKNGPTFQEVMEKILIMKLNDLDKNKYQEKHLTSKNKCFIMYNTVISYKW